MSKFLSEKKKLIQDVYEKASSETTETSFNGIVLYLEQILKDEFEALSYKSFENYYKSLIENDEDYKIKPPILDNLSRYLGYDTFKDYCSEWKTLEYVIQQAISKIVITIINKPILAMPSFLDNKNGMGVFGLILISSFLMGNVVLIEKKINNESLITKFIRIWDMEISDTDKQYMYWGGERYIATDSSDLGPQIKLIPMNVDIFKHLKKITREDTLTTENAMRKVWYDKSNNNVEFFTSPGRHPENGKALRDVSVTILNNHAGIQVDSLQIEE